MTLQPEIGQAMVVGDRRPYLVGLIVPDAEWTRAWAKARQVDADADALKENPDFLRALREAVDRANADLSLTERVRRFILADEPFTIANAEMTPSLKIRRHVIRERYQERLDALYKS